MPFLDRRGACCAAAVPGDGNARCEFGSPTLHFAAGLAVDPVRARYTGGAVGGVAVLRARLDLDGRTVAVGNAKLLGELGVPIAALELSAENLRHDGATAMFVAVEGRAAGIIAVADPIKATTPTAIE